VLPVQDNPLLALINEANTQFGDNSYNLGRAVSDRQLQRIVKEGKIPTAPTAKKIGEYVWALMHQLGAEGKRKVMLKMADDIDRLPNGDAWSKESFSSLFCRLARKSRNDNGHVPAAEIPSPVLEAVNIHKNEPKPDLQISVSKDGSFSISGNSLELLDRLVQFIIRTSNGSLNDPPTSTPTIPSQKAKNKKLKGGAS